MYMSEQNSDLEIPQSQHLGESEQRETEPLYTVLENVFNNLNKVPISRRQENTASGKSLVSRFYEKEHSKFKLATTCEVQIGRVFSYGDDQLKGNITDFMVRIETGEVDFFGQSAESYKLTFHQDENAIKMEMGRGIGSRANHDFPTLIEIVFLKDGKVSLGEKTNRDWLEDENVEGLLSSLDSITQTFIPPMMEGFVDDINRYIKLGKPKKIQQSLQILEDLYAKSTYDSYLQALVEETKNYKSGSQQNSSLTSRE